VLVILSSATDRYDGSSSGLVGSSVWGMKHLRVVDKLT
jgi:hypothetical protein